MPRLYRIFFAMILIALHAGCSSYSIQGRVIKGEVPMVTFVSPDDSLLEFGDPLGSAVVRIVRDPQSLSREEVGRVRSRSDGWFTLPIGSFGAGWMDEEWEISAQTGERYVRDRIRLPGRGSDLVMLVILSPGAPPPDKQEDLLGEFERYR